MTARRDRRAAAAQARRATPTETFEADVKTLLCWMRDEGHSVPRTALVLACAAEVAHAMETGDENSLKHVARLDQIVARHVARLRSN